MNESKGRVLRAIREETGAPASEALTILNGVWDDLVKAGIEARAKTAAGPIKEAMAAVRSQGFSKEDVAAAVFHALDEMNSPETP